jgi:hypothetical protein
MMSTTAVIVPTMFDEESETLWAAAILDRIVDDLQMHHETSLVARVAEARGLERWEAARVVHQALGLLDVELHWSGPPGDRRLLKMPGPAAVELDRQLDQRLVREA